MNTSNKIKNANSNSEIISLLKGIAICSVIIAHSPIKYSTIYYENLNKVYDKIGTIGVILFLIIGGYLYYGKTEDVRLFIIKKIKSTIIPWLFCSSVVFCISSTFGQNQDDLNIFSWIKFVLGLGSLYYYMTMYIFILFILYPQRNKINKIKIILLMIITIVSILLTNLSSIDFIKSNAYLNILNWIGFFALGMWIKSSNKLENIKNNIKRHINIILILTIICIYLGILIDKVGIAYFGVFSIPIEINISLLCLWLSIKMDNHKHIISQLIKNAGEYSFTIYLLHMPIAGIVNILVNNYMPFIGPLKFVIILLIMMGLIYMYNKIINKIKIFKFTNILIGLR